MTLPWETSNLPHQNSMLELAKMLLVAWGCGLIWGIGSFLTMFAVFAWAFGEGFLFVGTPDDPTFLVCGLILTVPVIFLGPVLLCSYYEEDSRTGWLAVLAGVVALIIGWVIAGIIGTIVVSFPYSPREAIDRLWLPAEISIGASAAVITVILRATEPFPRRNLGLALGLLIGLVVSVVSGITLGGSILANDDAFHFLWQIPPLIWVSEICFLEVVKMRSNWKAIPVWALFVSITFALPFVVVPSLARVF